MKLLYQEIWNKVNFSKYIIGTLVWEFESLSPHVGVGKLVKPSVKRISLNIYNKGWILQKPKFDKEKRKMEWFSILVSNSILNKVKTKRKAIFISSS
jgi:hypothetical protein